METRQYSLIVVDTGDYSGVCGYEDEIWAFEINSGKIDLTLKEIR